MAYDESEIDKAIIDSVENIVLVTDETGKVLRFNNAGTRILGYASEEVVGKILWDVLSAPERRPIARERFRRLLSGEGFEMETVFLTKDGRRRNMSFFCRGVPGVDRKIRFTIGAGTDITEKMQTEAALRESELRFRRMVDAAAIGIALVDQHGRYLHVNRAFCTLVGYSQDELVAMDLLQITHPDDRAENKRLFDSILGGQNNSYVLEKRYLTRDGNWIWVKVSASLASGGNGQPPTIIGLFENISDRRDNEAALLRANTELQQLNETLEQRVAERTAELTARTRELALVNDSVRESERHYRKLADSHLSLAREMEHRVRNNLGGLLGLITVMRGRATDTESFADAIESRIAGMRHVHTLLAQGQWTPISLRELVEGMLATLQHMAPCKATVEVEGADLAVAPRRVLPLTLVLVEWFTNSCKYGPHSVPGGRLEIHWEQLDHSTSNLIRLSWRETGGPPILQPIQPSLGTDLVQGFVRRELAGVCQLRFPPEGADHFIEFSLNDARTDIGG